MLEAAEKCQGALQLMEEDDEHFVSTLFEGGQWRRGLGIGKMLGFFSSF